MLLCVAARGLTVNSGEILWCFCHWWAALQLDVSLFRFHSSIAQKFKTNHVYSLSNSSPVFILASAACTTNYSLFIVRLRRTRVKAPPFLSPSGTPPSPSHTHTRLLCLFMERQLLLSSGVRHRICERFFPPLRLFKLQLRVAADAELAQHQNRANGFKWNVIPHTLRWDGGGA